MKLKLKEKMAIYKSRFADMEKYVNKGTETKFAINKHLKYVEEAYDDIKLDLFMRTHQPEAAEKLKMKMFAEDSNIDENNKF